MGRADGGAATMADAGVVDAGPGPAERCAATASAPTVQPGPTPGMLLVPAGPFWMGCNETLEASWCTPDQRPGRCVSLSAFELDEVEVSQAAYQRCVSARTCTTPDLTRNSYYPELTPLWPVNMLTWQQAREYCAFAGKRLPTEAEWEKAARGVDGRVFPWGNEAPTCTVVNYLGCGGPLDVGARTPSPYGLKDMAGNAWEFVEDFHGPYDTLPLQDPVRRDGGTERVIRGGSWLSPVPGLRAAFRIAEVSPLELSVGFRCARSVP